MRWIYLAAVVAVALFTWSLSRLSTDAVGMAIGMLLGVLSGVPTAALVLVASRSNVDQRKAPDYDIDVRPTYADDVTPYTHLFRRATGMPALLTRRQQINHLQAVLNEMEREAAEVEGDEGG